MDQTTIDGAVAHIEAGIVHLAGAEDTSRSAPARQMEAACAFAQFGAAQALLSAATAQDAVNAANSA